MKAKLRAFSYRGRLHITSRSSLQKMLKNSSSGWSERKQMDWNPQERMKIKINRKYMGKLPHKQTQRLAKKNPPFPCNMPVL